MPLTLLSSYLPADLQTQKSARLRYADRVANVGVSLETALCRENGHCPESVIATRQVLVKGNDCDKQHERVGLGRCLRPGSQCLRREAVHPQVLADRLAVMAGHADGLGDVTPLRPQSAYSIYLRHARRPRRRSFLGKGAHPLATEGRQEGSMVNRPVSSLTVLFHETRK